MKGKRQAIKTVWGVIVTFSVMLGLIASVLQISGTVDFGSLLILPIHFFSMEIPIYYAILSAVALAIILYIAVKLGRRYKRCILDFVDARKMAILCQTPRTTDFLRQQYEIWESQRTWVF